MKVFKHPRTGQTITFPDTATESEIRARLAEVDFHNQQTAADLRAEMQKTRAEGLPMGLQVAQAGASYAAQASQALLAVPRLVGQVRGLTAPLVNQLPTPLRAAADPMGFLLNKAAPMPDGRDTFAAFWDETSKMIEESAQIDPNDNFVTKDLAGGLGSLVGMALTSGTSLWGSLGSRGRSMVNGAINGFVENYDRSKDSGSDELGAVMNGLTGAAIGTSEAWTLTKWLDRFGMRTGTSVGQRLGKLRTAGKEMLQEAGQEAFQTFSEDASAAWWTPEDWDFARTLRGTARAAAAGGILGGGMSGVTQGVEGHERANRLAQIRKARQSRQIVEDVTEEITQRRARTAELGAAAFDALNPPTPSSEVGPIALPSPRDISQANRRSGMDIGFGFLGHFTDPQGRYDRAAAEEQITRAINNTLQSSGTATFIHKDGRQVRITSAERQNVLDAEGRVIGSPIVWTDHEGGTLTVDDIDKGGTLQLRGYTRNLPAVAPRSLRNVKPSVPQGPPMPVETDVLPPQTLNYTPEQKARWSKADPSSILWLGENHQTRLESLIRNLEQRTSGRQMTPDEREQYLWWRFQREHLRRFMNEGATGRRDPRKVLNDIANLLQLQVDHSAGFPLTAYPQYAKDEIGKAGALLTQQGQPIVGTPKEKAEGGAAPEASPRQELTQEELDYMAPVEGTPLSTKFRDVGFLLSAVSDPITKPRDTPEDALEKMSKRPPEMQAMRPLIRFIDPNDPTKVRRAISDPPNPMSGTRGLTTIDAFESLRVPGKMIASLAQPLDTNQGGFEAALVHGWVVHPDDLAKIPWHQPRRTITSEERIPSLDDFRSSATGPGPVATLKPDDPQFGPKLLEMDEAEVQLAAFAAGVNTGQTHAATVANMAKAAALSQKVLTMTDEDLAKDVQTQKQVTKLFKSPGAAPASPLAKAELIRGLVTNFINFPERLATQRYEQFLLHTLNYRGDLTPDELNKIVEELRVSNPQLAKSVEEQTKGKKAGQFSFKTILPPSILSETVGEPGTRGSVPLPTGRMFSERLTEQERKEKPVAAPAPAPAPKAAGTEDTVPGDPIPKRVDVVNIPTQADGIFVYLKEGTDRRIFRAVQSEDPALLVLRDKDDKIISAGKDAVQRLDMATIQNSREARVNAGLLKRSDLPEVPTTAEMRSVSDQMGLSMDVLVAQARALEGQGGQLGRLRTQPLLGLVKMPPLAQPHPSTATVRVVDSKGYSHIVPRDSFQPVKVRQRVKAPTAKQRKADKKSPPIQPGLNPAKQPSKQSTDDPFMGTEEEKVTVQQHGTTSNEDTPPAGRNTPIQQKGMVAVPKASEPQATMAFRSLINNAEFLATYPHAGELLRAGLDYYPRSWEEGRAAAKAVMQGYALDPAGMEQAFADFTRRDTLHRMADNFRPYILGELLSQNRQLQLLGPEEDQMARLVAIEEGVWQHLTLNQSVAGQTLQASQYILSQFSPRFVAAKLNLQFKKYWKGDMTPEQQQTIMGLVEKLQQSYEGQKSTGIPKSRVYQELVDYIERNINISPWDKFQSWWYASVLSMITTQFENAMTAVNVMTNGFMGAITSGDPVTGFYFYMRSLTNLTDLNQLASTYKVFQEIPTEHFNKLEDSGVFDYEQRRGELTPARIVTAAIRRQWLKNAIERNRDAGGARRLLNVVAVPTRNINVFMSAMDFTLAQMGADQKAAFLAIKANKKGGDVSNREYRDMIKSIISTDKESMAAAKREAVLEAEAGYIQPSDIPLRAREIALKKRPDQIVELADRYGLEVTGNIEPYGVPGTIYRGFLQLRREVPALRVVAPFMRYAANWTNTTVNFLPGVGLGRYAFQQYLNSKDRQFLGREWGRLDNDMSRDQEVDTLQRMRAQGTVGLLALFAAFFAGVEGLDDEEPFLQFTGGFKFLPPAKRKQLMNSGIMPYSIRVMGKSFSYRQLPFSGALAIVGEITDRARYDNQPIDYAEMTSRLGGALSTGALMTLDMPALVGLSDLLMALNPRAYGSTDTQYGPLQAVPELLKRYATGAIVPGWLKDVDQWFDPHVKDRASLNPTEWLTRDIPIARRKVSDSINVLGDPVLGERGPWRRFLGPDSTDLAPTPEDKALYDEMARRNQQGVFIPWALEVTFPREDGLRVRLSDKDAYLYRRAVGTAMKQTIQQNLEWFKGLSREDAQDWLRQKHGELSNWVANSFDWNPANAE